MGVSPTTSHAFLTNPKSVRRPTHSRIMGSGASCPSPEKLNKRITLRAFNMASRDPSLEARPLDELFLQVRKVLDSLVVCLLDRVSAPGLTCRAQAVQKYDRPPRKGFVSRRDFLSAATAMGFVPWDGRGPAEPPDSSIRETDASDDGAIFAPMALTRSEQNNLATLMERLDPNRSDQVRGNSEILSSLVSG